MIKIKISERKLTEARSRWRFLDTISNEASRIIFERMIRDPVEMIKPGLHFLNISDISSISDIPTPELKKYIQELKNIKFIILREPIKAFKVGGFYTDKNVVENGYRIEKNSIVIEIHLKGGISNFSKFKRIFSRLRDRLKFVMKHELIHYLRFNDYFTDDYKFKSLGLSKLNNNEKKFIDFYFSYQKDEIETYSHQAVQQAQDKRKPLSDEINNVLKSLDRNMITKAGRTFYYKFRLAVINYISNKWQIYKDSLEPLKAATLENLK